MQNHAESYKIGMHFTRSCNKEHFSQTLDGAAFIIQDVDW